MKKGGNFKNIKLGKDVHRQMKRRLPSEYSTPKHRPPERQKKPKQ